MFETELKIKKESIKVSINSLTKNIKKKIEKPGDQYNDECYGGTFTFSSMDKQKTCDLTQYDPRYENMVVIPGLNFKGRCKNPNCLSNTNQTYQTWVRKGIGKFDISEDRFDNKCVVCKENIPASSILTFGITSCIATITGRIKTGDSEDDCDKIQLKIEETDGKFIEFDDTDDKIGRWVNLKVDIEPI